MVRAGKLLAVAKGLRPRRRWVVVLASAAALVLLVAGGAFWLFSQQGPPGCNAPASPDQWEQIDWTVDPPKTSLTDRNGEVTYEVREVRWKQTGEATWRVILWTEMENGTSDRIEHSRSAYSLIHIAKRPFDISCFDVDDPSTAGPGEIVGARVGFTVNCEPKGMIDLVMVSRSGATQDPLQLTFTDKASRNCLPNAG